MKSAFIAGAIAATGVLAQTTKQSNPFFLKLSSSNATYDGRYLYACHTGAALQTLCVGQTNVTNKDASTFYLNTTVYEGRESPTGTLWWDMKLSVGVDGRQQVVPEPLSLEFNAGTNVAMTWFSPGSMSRAVSAGFNESSLYISTYPDDSKFEEGVYPVILNTVESKNWYACWLMAYSYYYNTLAWVTGGRPQNPTCQAVSVVKVDITA